MFPFSHLEAQYRSKLDAINNKWELRKENADRAYETTLEKLSAESELIISELGIHGQAWDSPGWENYQKPDGIKLPLLTRCGLFDLDNEISSIKMPALLPIIGGRNILIKANGKGKERARLLIQSLVLRLLATVPPNKLKLLCIDPVQLGATMAGFIKGIPEVTGKAWFDQSEIESKLSELESHIGDVKQNYLGISYSTIEEYNSKAGQIEEPYRLLVIADFPNRFTESSARRLVSIATTGIGAGVYTLVMMDCDQAMAMPRGFVLDDLERTATILYCNEDKDYPHDTSFHGADLVLDTPPEPAHFEAIIDDIKKAVSESKDIKISFPLLSQQDWWKMNSRSGISVHIGQFGARESQYFSFNEDFLNSALVIGVPGSGKSTLLHTIISGLALTYSPSEVELYLIDCKQVEFKEYAKYKLPHAKVVATHGGRDFCLSVMKKLEAELEKRERILSSLGVISLDRYRASHRENIPRIVLIIDEFQEIFGSDDAISRKSESILDKLVRLGRAFGIHVVLASQSLSGKNSISQTIIEQMAIRIALKLRSDGDARRLLSDGNDAARYLSRPGEAIYNDQNGLKEHNRRFQVYWFDENVRHGFLKGLRLLADESSFSEYSPIVFDGDAPAFVQDNRKLSKIISEPNWPTLQRGHAVMAWLGAPTEIKEETAAVFKRQSASNLLVIGEREYEERLVSILMSSLISIAAQQGPQQAKFFVFNATDVGETWHDLPIILNGLPHDIEVITRDKTKSQIMVIGDELEARRKTDENDRPAIYAFFLGLHYISSLRTPDKKPGLNKFDLKSDEGGSKPPVHDIFYNILKYGPEKGIHTLLWCNRYVDLRQMLDAEVRDLFDMRVIFQSTESDSRLVIDSDMATKLGTPNRAILYDRHNSSTEKFIPYEPPSPEWLGLQANNLRSR